MNQENHGFYSLFLSSSVSTIGDGIRTLIIPLIILYVTKSTFVFGLIFSAEFLVWIVSTGVSGYFIDRTNRVKNLFFSDFIMFFLMLSVSLSYFFANTYFILFIVLAVIGTSIGETFYNPASFSLLPDIVHKDLDKRNALLSMGINASMIGGYVIAGLGFSSISWGILLLIDATSFLLSAIIVYTGLRKFSRSEKKEKIHIWRETKETFTFLKTKKLILYTIIFGFVFNFLTSGMAIILPTIAVENTSTGSISLSIFYICELAGMLLGGSIIIGKRKRKLLTYLLVGSAGEGLVMSIMGLSLLAEGIIIIVMAVILLVNGIFSELLNIPLRVWYQKLVPRDKRAKVINTKDLILTIPMVIAFPLIGYLLAHHSEWLTIFIFGFSAVIVSIFEFILLKSVSPWTDNELQGETNQ
ncbi:MAG: MFS transporter [Candidatus Thermoplasmatota archaeon]|nr:MFS transporter [Candidatus Thermoplasmatota archaeon]